MATILVTGARVSSAATSSRRCIDGGPSRRRPRPHGEDDALVRRACRPGSEHAVETRIGDVTEPATLPAAMAGVDASSTSPRSRGTSTAARASGW